MNVESQETVKEYLGRFKVFVDYLLKKGSHNKGYSIFTMSPQGSMQQSPAMPPGTSETARTSTYDQVLYNAFRTPNAGYSYVTILMSWNSEKNAEKYVKDTLHPERSTDYKRQEVARWKKLFKGIQKIHGTLICAKLADLAITTFAEFRVAVAPPNNAGKHKELKQILKENDGVLNAIEKKLTALNKLASNGQECIAEIVEGDELPTDWESISSPDVTYIKNDIHIPGLPNVDIPKK
ncbi:hypothetical protein Ddc_09257 [Ditylenchus destructor]|nr:hypothetical protein Ddc_09257 [Ditylenchus destructor]